MTDKIKIQVARMIATKMSPPTSMVVHWTNELIAKEFTEAEVAEGVSLFIDELGPAGAQVNLPVLVKAIERAQIRKRERRAEQIKKTTPRLDTLAKGSVNWQLIQRILSYPQREHRFEHQGRNMIVYDSRKKWEELGRHFDELGLTHDLNECRKKYAECLKLLTLARDNGCDVDV